MKPSRSILVWSALALCAVLVLGAMAVLTRNIQSSKREQSLAEARAVLEEQTRLALWRMDAAGAAILLRENQRPPIGFQAPVSKEAAEARLRFEVRASGIVAHSAATDELAILTRLLSKNGDITSLLHDATTRSETAWQALPKDNAELKKQSALQSSAAKQSARYNSAYQQDYNQIEQGQRAKVLESQEQAVMSNNSGNLSAGPDLLLKEIGSMRPVWIEGELFLLRQLSLLRPAGATPASMMQGVWLNQPMVRQTLLAEIGDLLPGAALVPQPTAAGEPLALVSLPFRLQRAEPLPTPDPPWSGLLLAGWVAVFGAFGSVAWLVHGVMRLSDRRASFVSAVTHELRTPLTTFRLYSEMLEADAVKPEKRGDYLRVLAREANRLSHLVENVLAFSRIERGNARSHVTELEIESLLEQCREHLADRLATAGLQLEMDSGCPAKARVDTAAVEHVLFNLIDNAAKYAAGSKPPVVTISTAVAGGWIEITVSDHGPGIPPAERRRIFRPFHKSAHEAAESQPGVGLGLALSRRLAKAQGGTLQCDGSGRGACFILRLPCARGI